MCCLFSVGFTIYEGLVYRYVLLYGTNLLADNDTLTEITVFDRRKLL